jgi:hypothetical protein
MSKKSRVLTVEFLAIIFKTTPQIIEEKFKKHKSEFKREEHYSTVYNQKYFTVSGAKLLAKIINTDEAWEGYEDLIDTPQRKPVITSTDLIAASEPDPEAEQS